MAKRKNTRKPKEEIKKEEETLEVNEVPVAEEAEQKEENNTPAVEPEETPKKEETKVQEAVEKAMVNPDSPGFLKKVNTAKDLEELYDLLRSSGKFAGLAGRLKTYSDFVSKNTDPKKLAARHYDLYLLLVDVLSKDYGEFSKAFKIINKAFLLGKDNAFNPTKMLTGIQEWKWGEAHKTRYVKLITVIAELANPGARKETLKSLSVEKAVDGLGEKAKENILRFYK